jgi:hypothetical protein
MDNTKKRWIAYDLLKALLIEEDRSHVKRTRHERVKAMVKEARSFPKGDVFAEALIRDITDDIFLGEKASRSNIVNTENKGDVAYGVLVRLMVTCNGKFCASRFETMLKTAKSLYKDEGLEFARLIGHDLIEYVYFR